MSEVNKHYQGVTFQGVKMDPYLIASIFKMGGGPLEHIMKKCLRGTSKGHTEEKILKEIICSATRGLEILNLEYDEVNYENEFNQMIDKLQKENAVLADENIRLMNEAGVKVDPVVVDDNVFNTKDFLADMGSDIRGHTGSTTKTHE